MTLDAVGPVVGAVRVDHRAVAEPKLAGRSVPRCDMGAPLEHPAFCTHHATEGLDEPGLRALDADIPAVGEGRGNDAPLAGFGREHHLGECHRRCPSFSAPSPAPHVPGAGPPHRWALSGAGMPVLEAEVRPALTLVAGTAPEAGVSHGRRSTPSTEFQLRRLVGWSEYRIPSLAIHV